MKRTVLLFSLLALCSLGFAQDPSDASPAAGGGWRRAADNRQGVPDQPTPDTADRPLPRADDRPGLPAQLTIPQGTFVTVRVNEWLSSDRNAEGDAFSGTLMEPIIVDGFVVAHRGQTVGGRVAEVERAGHRQAVSRLGLQITELTVADGQQVPVQSQLASRTPPSTPGRDAGTIVGTTVAGAAVGAMAGRGVGAAIGAIAGAATGAILTRGRPAVVYPETVLTFRLDSPATVSTERAPQAFHVADQSDYERGYDRTEARRYPARRAYPPYPQPCYSCAPYYAPRIAVFYGRGFYWGPRYWGPRYYPGWGGWGW